jgi:hypothetical protein
MACGTHSWKIQTRIAYQSAQTTTAEVYGETEYSTGGGAVWLGKTIIAAGARVVSNLSFGYRQSVQTSGTYYTSWTDVDQAPGTITTGC